MDKQEFHQLLEKWVSQQLTEEEASIFLNALSEPGKLEWMSDEMYKDLVSGRFSGLTSVAQQTNALKALQKRISQQTEQVPVKKIFSLRSTWFRAAAAAVLIVVLGSIWFISGRRQQGYVQNIPTIPQIYDVQPGGSKATLTLEDGTVIVLDSAEEGVLAKQGGSIIKKMDSGKVIYTLSGNQQFEAPNAQPTFNTISTPKGGQYQLTLSDGTAVWLNSASSIRVTTFFSGNKRVVSITGEVYFEVAKNTSKPFKVTVNDETFIEVLGTSFNINAYNNEPDIQTTLLEGSVKMNYGKSKTTLQPGEQVRLNALGRISLIKDADIEKVMAWKNGFFNFEDADLKEVMNQLERWYDIEVTYEKKIPVIQFGGEMSRNVPLSDVLKGLKDMNIQFKMVGERRLIVTPN